MSIKWTSSKKALVAIIVFPLLIGVISTFMSDSPKTLSPAEIQAQQEKAAQDAKELAEWQKTPAGKICAKYPGWDRDICTLISKKEVRVGMTPAQVRLSIGSPDKINTTNTAHGTHEQWVYGYNYIYFDNGVLTVIQQTK